MFLTSGDGTNVLRMIDYMKVMFTFCAFVFDLYKWCIFIIATTVEKGTDKTKMNVGRATQEELTNRRQTLLMRSLIVV